MPSLESMNYDLKEGTIFLVEVLPSKSGARFSISEYSRREEIIHIGTFQKNKDAIIQQLKTWVLIDDVPDGNYKIFIEKISGE